MECGQETWESAEQSGEQDQNDDGNIRPRTRMAANKKAVESGREGRGSRVSVHGQELMGSQKNELSTEAASQARSQVLACTHIHHTHTGTQGVHLCSEHAHTTENHTQHQRGISTAEGKRPELGAAATDRADAARKVERAKGGL